MILKRELSSLSCSISRQCGRFKLTSGQACIFIKKLNILVANCYYSYRNRHKGLIQQNIDFRYIPKFLFQNFGFVFENELCRFSFWKIVRAEAILSECSCRQKCPIVSYWIQQTVFAKTDFQKNNNSEAHLARSDRIV